MSRERDHDDDRPRLSWSEIDKLRDRPRFRSDSDRRAQARVPTPAAAKHYLKKAGEELFAKHKGGARGDELARAIRDARGTPGLSEACRAYLEELGAPLDASLASHFLDAPDADLIVAGLEALEALRGAGSLEPTPGLRTQLRLLAQSSDDDVAYAAEELLQKL